MSVSLHKIWWLWLPMLFMVVQVVIEALLPSGLLSTLHSENGPHETFQFLIITTAFVVAITTLSKIKNSPWLVAWISLAALCSFYVAGEEISWGQHLLAWSTPEFWGQLNDQGETNFHNTSSWLDQKPRFILLIGVVVGGLIFPALQKFKPGFLPEKFSIIYPPSILSVTAAIAIGINLTDKIDENLRDIILFERASEVEEIYLFYFVLLYLIILRWRIMQQ